MATGTIRSVNSAKSALNLNKNGSLHVVPSGQTTRSPLANSLLIFSASTWRILVNRMVGIGDMISEKREMEYVTAGILRFSTVDKTTGSIMALCVHTNRTPELPFDTGGGGFPLTMTLPPFNLITYGMAHIGSIIP
ncbi:hypothetical protein CFOL_v3_18661 [Cephalotus follicularis]|uniref:Uncharacterized protein n=1 Tax=Cephalotus follicularis TaxID=3775 RepID=A0A1Q3C544_CEPFO|nr:hypothetical protein CFOL_v3_18661 [Cephalotus follicularis]